MKIKKVQPIVFTPPGDSIFYQLGLKAGLEVHQQLNTFKKLFCHCPAKLINHPHNVEILRHMRPTLSELGEYDGTALMEFKTKKEIIYQLYNDVVCTYEMDDTPPFLLNQQALQFALEIAMLFDCNIVDEIHISRKQYLDGSIPTGFQRTAIVGINGSFPLDNADRKRVHIWQLGLEEDSCREVSNQGHTIVFKTDRLSIPLVEVVTAPELKTPKEVFLAGEQIRRVLRASGKVRRGAGAARQDVNVSIKGGSRVEIKGVPSTKLISNLVASEALRQKALLEIRDSLRSRGITKKTLSAMVGDLKELFKNTKIKIIRQALEQGGTVKGIKLVGFGGLFSYPTQPGLNFSFEFSERVRVIACLDQKPNLIHTDDHLFFKRRKRDLKKIQELFKARHVDVVVIVWGNEEDVNTAIEEIRLRALDAASGVPNETRTVLSDCQTGFERILPGPNRMYPDTDLPPCAIDEKRIKDTRANLPLTPWARRKKYQNQLNHHLLDIMELSPWQHLVDYLIKHCSLNPIFVASTILDRFRCLTRKGYQIEEIKPDDLLMVFKEVEKKKILATAVIPIIKNILQNGTDVQEALGDKNFKPVSITKTKSFLRKNLSDWLSECFSKQKEAQHRFLMGKIMHQYRYRVDGKKLSQIVEDSLG